MVKEAEAALAAARRTADGVRAKGALGLGGGGGASFIGAKRGGAGRGGAHRSRIDGAVKAALNKGSLLWAELAEVWRRRGEGVCWCTAPLFFFVIGYF